MDNWTTIDARTGDYTGIRLTSAQVRTLDALRANLPKFDYYGHPEDYEIKRFELSQAEPDPALAELMQAVGMRPRKPDVFVLITTGMIDDAGTMAEFYCRKHRHLKIGPRGGIESSPINRKGFRPVSLFDALNTEYWK